MKFGKNKKGLSEIVGYVILIVISISLAVLVYGWLRSQLPQDQPNCPDNIGIIIRDYTCNADKTINITVENKGYFNIEGINIVMANITSGVTAYNMSVIDPGGAVAINNQGYIYFVTALAPNAYYSTRYSYQANNKITKIQITPFVYSTKSGSSKKQIILCVNNKLTQDISCN